MNKLHIKKRPDGRFERKITLYDPISGKSHQKHVYAWTQSELIEKIRNLELKYSNLSFSEYTVGQFIKYYMDAKRENDPGTATLDTYNILLRNYVYGTEFAEMPIDSVNIPACRRFLQDFTPKANVNGSRTKQFLYVLLHAIFKQAWKEKLISENPFDFIDKPKHQAKERLTLTKEQFDAMLNVIDSEQMKRIFIFARNTGMRRGEICGLKVKDLHLDQSYIHVQNGVKLHDGEWMLGSLKTKNSVRTIIIPPAIVELLNTQLQFNKRKGSDSFVFQGRSGKFLTPDSLSRAFCIARSLLKYPESMTFHSLRATVATYLAEHDVNPKKIQAKLGHSTIAMTMDKYVKHTPEMDTSIIELLQNM